ncbi:hypothetical protein quinque_000077 [Culex quinquefasciatus]
MIPKETEKCTTITRSLKCDNARLVLTSPAMSLNRFSSPDVRSTYSTVEAAFLELFQSVKKYQNKLESLERSAQDCYSHQDALNGDLNRRLGQLGSDLRNNRAFEKDQRQRQLDQLATLERDRVAWSGELDRLEQGVKNIAQKREEKIVELRDVSDKSKKAIDELEVAMKQTKEQIATQRTGIMAISIGLLLVGVYVRKGF